MIPSRRADSPPAGGSPAIARARMEMTSRGETKTEPAAIARKTAAIDRARAPRTAALFLEVFRIHRLRYLPQREHEVRRRL